MENTTVWCIYMHRNKINNKVYIGQTKCNNPNNRWRNGTNYQNTYFGRAINKYGWDNFEHIILETNIQSIEEADAKERFYIAQYDSNNPEKGYNLTNGGHINSIQNKEVTLAKSKRMKEQWQNEEYKIKMSQKSKEYWDNHPELKAQMGQSVKCVETGQVFNSYHEAGEWCGLIQYKNSFLMYFRGERYSCGKHPETKIPLHWIKIDNLGNEVSGIQNFNTDKTDYSKRGGIKKVRCKETGEIFYSLEQAKNWCGLKSSSSITNAIKGRTKYAGLHPQTREKLHWEYIE